MAGIILAPLNLLFKGSSVVIFAWYYQYYQTVFCPKIITRKEWGAKEPKSVTLMSLPVPYVIIHHTFKPGACYTTKQCIAALQGIQRYHQDVRKWEDIGYNFAIGGDGNIYEGRGWNSTGAHATVYNDKSIGIVLIGDFTDTNPPKIMENKLKALMKCGVKINSIKKNYILYGHRQVRNTECPGDTFYKTLKTWPHWSPKQ